MRSGQVVVVGIVAIALAATGYAWLHHRGQGHHSLEFWGSENALLVRRAKTVTLSRLERTVSDDALGNERLRIDGIDYSVTNNRDISDAKGLIHCRQALIFDPTYDWTQSPKSEDQWRYAIRFVNNSEELVVMFDPASKLIGHGQPVRVATVKMPDRFESFFEEKLALPENPAGE